MNEDPNMNKKVTEQKLEDRKIVVKDDGTIEVTEIVKTIYLQDYRDFLSDVRNMQKFREQIEDTLKPAFSEKQQERIDSINKDIENMQPFLDEAETKWQKNQEYLRNKNFADGIKRELLKSESEINLNYISSVYDNLKDNEDVMGLLSDEEKEKLKSLKLKAVRRQKR
jgi:predicted DNA binding CopG/RHH family protein